MTSSSSSISSVVPPTGVRADEKPTALVLTQQEWNDLARVCRFYEATTDGWKDKEIVRRLDLCRRVQEAAR